MNTVFSGFIIGGGYNASSCWVACPTDDDRFPLEIRITLLFDSGKEGVHVDVKDSSHKDENRMGSVFFQQ